MILSHKQKRDHSRPNEEMKDKLGSAGWSENS